MDQKRQTVAVLGCGGFIGSHLLAGLLSTGRYKVLGVDRKSDKIKHLINNENFEFTEGDIYNDGSVYSIIETSDVVVSLAAICNPSLYNTIPIEVIESNFVAPMKIIKICSDLKKWLIHFSTSEVYGKTIYSQLPQELKTNDCDNILHEDSTPLILGPVQAQRWSYACAKQLTERLIFAYNQKKELEYTIVRPFNFIGPGMDYLPGIDGDGIPRVLACFIENLLSQKPLLLVDGGKNRRVFTYIDDAVESIIRIIECQAKNQIFNIGNPDNEVSIEELAYLMIRIYKELFPEYRSFDYKIENVDSKSFYGIGYEDSDRRIPDITKANMILNWKPRTNLETTLRKTIQLFIQDYKSQHKIR